MGSVKFKKNDGQNITRNKAAKKQFLGKRLHIFNNCRQEFLHEAVFQIIG